MKSQLDNQYFNNLFTYSNVPIIIWDADFKITRFNIAFEKLTGRKEESVIGKSIELLFPESLASTTMEIIRMTQTGEHLEDNEIEIIHVNGSVNTLIWNSAQVLDVDNNTPFATIAQGRNITKRKQVERKLAQLNQQKDLILDSVAEGILGLDLNGNHTFVNPVAAKMLGYEQEELIGLYSHGIWHHTKADGRNYPPEDCPIYQAFRDGKVHRGVNDVFWKKDGSSFPVQFASMPIFEQGLLVGAVVTFTDITERKQIEEALNQSEQNMKSFVNDSLLCIYFFNTETKKIIYANPSFCTLLGYLPEEIDTLTIYNFLNHTIESVDAFVNQVVQTKQRNIGERQWKRKDGKLIDMFVNASHGDHNASKIIYISAQDISERKKTEKELVESEARLSQGELVAKFGNWELDLEHQVMYSSAGAVKIYGADKYELSFKTVKKFPLHEYREKLDEALIDLIAQRKSYDVEFKIKRGNDGVIVDVHSIAEYDPETKTVFGILQDITERKKAQQEIIESEKKFRSVIQSAKDSIILANGKGEIIFWNYFAEKTFGYSADEVLGKPLTIIMHQRYHSSHLQKFGLHASSNQELLNDKRIELYGLNKNGTEFPIELSISHWTNGTERFYCGIIRDVTERKKAEEKQDTYIKKLSEIAFLQGHQVRRPVASLLGLASLFVFDNPSDPINSEVLSRVEIATRELDKVIKEIVKKTNEIETTQ